MRINRNQFGEGTDISLFKFPHRNTFHFLAINALKKRQLFDYDAQVERKDVSKNVFPFSVFFNTSGFAVFGAQANHSFAGVGIAVADFKYEGSIDATVVFMTKSSHAVYKVGFGFHPLQGFPGKWSRQVVSTHSHPDSPWS